MHSTRLSVTNKWFPVLGTKGGMRESVTGVTLLVGIGGYNIRRGGNQPSVWHWECKGWMDYRKNNGKLIMRTRIELE